MSLYGFYNSPSWKVRNFFTSSIVVIVFTIVVSNRCVKKMDLFVDRSKRLNMGAATMRVARSRNTVFDEERDGKAAAFCINARVVALDSGWVRRWNVEHARCCKHRACVSPAGNKGRPPPLSFYCRFERTRFSRRTIHSKRQLSSQGLHATPCETRYRADNAVTG